MSMGPDAQQLVFVSDTHALCVPILSWVVIPPTNGKTTHHGQLKGGVGLKAADIERDTKSEARTIMLEIFLASSQQFQSTKPGNLYAWNGWTNYTKSQPTLPTHDPEPTDRSTNQPTNHMCCRVLCVCTEHTLHAASRKPTSTDATPRTLAPWPLPFTLPQKMPFPEIPPTPPLHVFTTHGHLSPPPRFASTPNSKEPGAETRGPVSVAFTLLPRC